MEDVKDLVEMPSAMSPGSLRHLGPALRIIRERAGFSVETLAAEARIDKNQLTKYEAGGEVPRIDTLGKILALVGMQPLSFFYLVHRLGRKDRDAKQDQSLQFELALVGGGFSDRWRTLGYRTVIETALDLKEHGDEQRAQAKAERQARSSRPRKRLSSAGARDSG